MSTVTIAYFAHDWTDAANRRRAAAFLDDGVEVLGFAMTRRDETPPDWVSVPLGQTKDNAYLQRVASIWRGARRAARARDLLAAADLVVARNLDMLATAHLALKLAGLKRPVVYECLDIHRFMVHPGVIGRVFRGAERALMRRSAALWISSPGFEREYFDTYQPGLLTPTLIENRVPPHPLLGDRPGAAQTPREPLRLGWFGNLRCARSLGLLIDLAERFPRDLHLEFHGYPALGEIPDFDARVAAVPNISYGGRYRAPDDLGRLYAEVDLVWSGDFMDEGFNSAWLLPNRLYEGGYFNCPPIAPEASETGRWIKERGSGFVVAEPLDETLPALISSLLEDNAPIIEARAALAQLPDDVFLQPPGTLAALLEKIAKKC